MAKGRKKLVDNRNYDKPKTAVQRRFHYSYHIVEETNVGKRMMWAKYPKVAYNQRMMLARKLLNMSYVNDPKEPLDRFNKVYSKLSRDQWLKCVEIKRKLINGNINRGIKDRKEVKENAKVYGLKEDYFLSQEEKERLAEIKLRAIDEKETMVEKTLDWQRKNWWKWMRKDHVSPEILEIESNALLMGEKKLIREYHKQPARMTFIENLKTGIFSQDWKIVVKCIEGTLKDQPNGSFAKHRHWVVWMGLFLAVLRSPNYVPEALKVLARNNIQTFTPITLPRRMGVEVGIWLTQEGLFNDAVLLLDEMEEMERASLNIVASTKCLKGTFKLAHINLVAGLFKAVFLYSVWKSNSRLFSEGEFEGSEADLERSGENALAAFEVLLELVEACEADVTTFMYPLVELTINYRSIDQAKQLLKGFTVKFYGNAFVEKAYYTFLKQYFPESPEIKECKRLKKKFKPKPEKHWYNGTRAIAAFKAKRLKEIGEKQYLKKLPNPEFSW